MSDIIITVENLSKSYLVGHRSGDRGHSNYTALRDIIGRKVLNVTRKAIDVVRGRQVVQGDEVEEFWALKDVSFEVKHGEVLGIIGHNGAGKSTLLKILSRITEPTRGKVQLRGRVASLLEVGTGFHPELTGTENIYLNGAILGMTRSEIRRKFDEIVAFADVEKFLDTPVKRYSSGMYVRLAFAVAAHLEPEILVVDEVLAVGDIEFQEKCLGKMRAVSGEGRTVLFVSHNMAAIRTLCSAGVLLSEGRIIFKGSPSEVITAYTNHAPISAPSVWIRPETLPLAEIGFEKISISVTGDQPTLNLICDMTLRCRARSPLSFIAVDIRDRTFGVIMQALPEPRPFIINRPGTCQLILEICLPPLIPGTYAVDFWLGHDYSQTVDHILHPLSFTLVNSPHAGRSYPHNIEHGSVAPISHVSRCVYSEIGPSNDELHSVMSEFGENSPILQ